MFDKHGGYITWAELSGIMKAMGFPDISSSLLTRAKIESNPSNSVGLDYRELQKLLHSDEMHANLDYTFNKHNSTYNIRVIKKIIAILITGALNVEEIREARMSFMLHEGELCSGITLDEKQLLASLRTTGKVIAPKKLSEWVKQVTPDSPGKVQLYEYLDLIKLCENKEEVKKQIPLPTTNINRNATGLYQLSDSSFLWTPEEKVMRKMDDDYEVQFNIIVTFQNMLTAIQAQQAIPKERAAKELLAATVNKEKTRQSKLDAQLENYLQVKAAVASTNTELRKAKVTTKERSNSSQSARNLLNKTPANQAASEVASGPDDDANSIGSSHEGEVALGMEDLDPYGEKPPPPDLTRKWERKDEIKRAQRNNMKELKGATRKPKENVAM